MHVPQFPDFFAAAPRITLFDPLAQFLGAAEAGVIEYTYNDAVRLAGHSCPTVAAAYLMTRRALLALYPGTAGRLPERGGIRVQLREPLPEGVTGVIANVVSLITGATHETGFKGIGGHFDRRGLLDAGADIPGQLGFIRIDTGAAVTVSARLERVPPDARVPALMPRCLKGTATPDEAALFRSLWQDRVRTLLLDHADDPEVIVLN